MIPKAKENKINLDNVIRCLKSPFVILQAGFILYLSTTEFGFDHPSRAGLDFEDFLLGLVAYIITLICGLFFCFFKREFALAVVQFTLPAILILIVSIFNI